MESDFPSNPFKLLTDQIVDGILVVDGKDETVQFANPASEKIFGKDREAFIGEHFGHPFSTGKATEIEAYRNGTSVTAEMVAGELQWEGRPSYIVSIRDITDQRQAREMSEKAGILEEEKHLLSHEIQNPLPIIKAALSNLMAASLPQGLNRAQKRHCRMMEANIRRLEHVIHNALLLVRLDRQEVQGARKKIPPKSREMSLWIPKPDLIVCLICIWKAVCRKRNMPLKSTSLFS